MRGLCKLLWGTVMVLETISAAHLPLNGSFQTLEFTDVIRSPRYSRVTVARHRQNIPCPSITALIFFFFFLFISCFCYWCVCVRVMMFTFYITSTLYMYSSFVFVINSYGSSRIVVFYIHLIWILGVQRFFFCYVSFHMLLTNEIKFPCLNTLKSIGSWYKII